MPSMIPRYTATMTAALLVLVAIALHVFLRVTETGVVGEIRQVVSLGNGHSFLRVALPFDPRTTPVVATDDLIKTQHVGEGDWILAYGNTTVVGGRSLLLAKTVVSFPVTALPLAHIADWPNRLRDLPFIAILAGCAMLVFGRQLIRITLALLFAAIGGLLAWSGANAAAAGGWITVSSHSIYPIAATVAIAGLALGWRSGAEARPVWERVGALALCYVLLPQIASRFGWPEAMFWVPLIIIAALPFAGYGLIGALLLVVGLDARGEAVMPILIASVVVVFAVRAWTALPPLAAGVSGMRKRDPDAQPV